MIAGMDSMTLGAIAVGALGLILFLIIKFTSSGDESSFEKAYKEKQLGLLLDDTKEKNAKPKQKPAKAKKDKKAPGEKAEEVAAAKQSDSEKENLPSKPVKEEKAKEKKTAKPEPEPVKTEKKEKTPEKQQVAQVKEDEIVKKEENDVQATPAADSAESAVESKKKNKKANGKAKAVEEEPVVVEEFVEPKAKKAKKPKEEKKTSPAPAPVPTQPILSLTDLDFNKVLTRFSGIEEVEPEYISYLATFFHENNATATKLHADAAALRRSVGEAEKKVDMHNNARLAAEKELQQQQRVVQELASKTATANSISEQKTKQAQSLNADNEKMRRELDQLRKSLAERAAAPVATAEMLAAQREVEELRAEAKVSVSRVAQLEQELRSLHQSTDAAAKKYDEQTRLLKKSTDDELVGRDAQLTETREYAKVINEKFSQVEQEKNELTKKLEALLAQTASAEQQFQAREKMHTDSIQSLETLIKDLNNEVAKFEEMKAEQAELREKLGAKEKELEDKSRRLIDIEKQLLSATGDGEKEAALVAQLESVQAELAKNTSAHQAALASANQNDAVEAEGVRIHFGERPAASSVFITGSFNDWNELREMDRDEETGDFVTLVHFFKGAQKKNKIAFKFVVDGDWITSTEYLVELDSKGNQNNYINL